MSKFTDIIKKHNATYYDYSTGVNHRVWPRYLKVFFVAILCLLLFGNISVEIVTALITVQAILIGFSFSVTFFLMSGVIKNINNDGSIEYCLKIKKLNRLSNELFYNVSYYNIVAIMSVILSLVILLPKVELNEFVLSIITAKRWSIIYKDNINSYINLANKYFIL